METVEEKAEEEDDDKNIGGGGGGGKKLGGGGKHLIDGGRGRSVSHVALTNNTLISIY